VLFCNELLDAMPVHRLGWDLARAGWFEWGVTLLNESFAWTRLGQLQFLSSEQRAFLDLEPRGCLSCQPQLWPAELLAALPDGFTTEVCPSAEAWWDSAVRVLDRGEMVAIDYGFTAEELMARGPIGGTLRAYHRHRLADSVLDDPGDQDITAHVNFSSIRAVGESAGLQTDALLTQ
jgi:SAM-dependent MidA family methyltransferase